MLSSYRRLFSPMQTGPGYPYTGCLTTNANLPIKAVDLAVVWTEKTRFISL